MPAWSTGGSPLTAGSGIAISGAGVISATGGGLVVQNTTTAAAFTTVINNGVDSETITDASGGVLFTRAGATGAVDLTGGMQAIASGSAWKVTAGLSIAGREAFSAGDIEGAGIVLGAADGKLLTFMPVRFDAFVGVGTHRWTDEDTYSATGKVETAKSLGDPWHNAINFGAPITLQVRLVSGTLQLWYSLTGRDNTWHHQVANDVALADHLTAVTHCGVAVWAYGTIPTEALLFDWRNEA